MVAQQSRVKKGKAGNGRKSLSQSIARNNNTATQDDENISINLILAILSTGIMAFIGILTETLTNVLFPGLMAEFHVDTSTVQWLTTGYLLTVALVTPLSSYFKRKLKLRTIFLTAIVLCITGCLMAACTLNFPMLMTARILQGAGTGIALPLMFNIILGQSPKSKIGMLMVAQAGHGSAGDTQFVTATQSDAHRGFVFLPIVMACAMLATYALPCPNTNYTTRKCPISSTSWMKPDSTGVYVRPDSSTHWMNLDAGRPVNVPIPPATGGIRTVRVLAAGRFLQ